MDGLTITQLNDVRSVKIEGQDYYSILDLIRVSTGKRYNLRTWWAKFKDRSSNTSVQWKRDLLSGIKLAPLMGLDNKKRLGDVVTLEAFNIFYTRHLEHSLQKQQDRTSFGNDEVINFHPVIETFLRIYEWNVTHHFKLP